MNSIVDFFSSLSMSWLDAALATFIVLAFISGWRRGLASSILSLIGVIAGAYAGTRIALLVVPPEQTGGVIRPLVTLGCVIVGSGIGSSIGSIIGRRIRKKLMWAALKSVDSIGGAAVDVVWVALMLWIIGSAVAVLPGSMGKQVRDSQVLRSIDSGIAWMSDGAAGAVSSGLTDQIVGKIIDLLDSAGGPRVFFALGGFTPPQVPPVDSAVTSAPAVRSAADSVVRVSGAAQGCDGTVSGSGFVFSRNRVMTNAHVVAGMREVRVELPRQRSRLGKVVYFDPRIDVAVVQVDTGGAAALTITGDPAAAQSAAAIGYPGGGPLIVVPARVSDVINARGSDIYGSSSVRRHVVVMRSSIREGDSGGPLVDSAGKVRAVVFAVNADDPSTGYALSATQVAAARTSTGTASVPTGRCAVGR